jgi:methylated-DNA-[protein]-cysteine S-methyltransferase
MSYVFSMMKSPVGHLKLVGSDAGLAGVLWELDRSKRVPHLQSALEQVDHPVLLESRRQLEEYFQGKRKRFNLKLDFVGSAFNRKIWDALLAIPYGETRTYGEIAKEVGAPRAMRAVGAANGRNPISIIAPCHRVIGSNGKLTGFAGGLETKAFLLRLETNEGDRPLSAHPLRFRNL